MSGNAMLPMGTVVTVLMFSGLIIAAELPALKSLPKVAANITAVLVLAGGCWNTLWYGLRHPTEFWGLAALVSGILMIITALYILARERLPSRLMKAKPVVLVVLFGYALMYAITIARM